MSKGDRQRGMKEAKKPKKPKKQTSKIAVTANFDKVRSPLGSNETKKSQFRGSLLDMAGA